MFRARHDALCQPCSRIRCYRRVRHADDRCPVDIAVVVFRWDSNCHAQRIVDCGVSGHQHRKPDHWSISLGVARAHFIRCRYHRIFPHLERSSGCIFGVASGVSNTPMLDTKDQIFALTNRVISLLLARHMLEFSIAGRPTPRTLSGDILQIPPGVMQKLKTPQWGVYTFSNTIGALLACLIVYDLLEFTFQSFLRPRIFAPLSKQETRASMSVHPVEYFFTSYLHLCAVMLVALSPLGCHAATVLAFVTICELLGSLYYNRIHISSLFFTAADHKLTKGNYGRYMTLWDRLCNTYEAAAESCQ